MSTPQDDLTTDFNADDPDALAAALFFDDPEVQAKPASPEAAKAAGVEAENVEPSTDDDTDAELTDEEKAAKAEKDSEDAKAAKDADPETETEQVYTVKVDGKEFEVDESELLAGYQRQKFFTQKTQSLAAERRAFEQERDAEIVQLRDALAYYALPTAKEPRPEDFADKTDQFMQAYGNWQQQTARQTEASQLLEAITAEETQRVLQRESGLLQKAIPEWADETVRQADHAKMVKSASDRYGFTPEEIAQVTDHRLLLLLRDAARVSELDAKPVVLKRNTKIKPKLTAGTKNKTDPRAEAYAKALVKLKNGSVGDDDFESLLFQ